MSDQKHIGARHASLERNIPDRRQACLTGYRHAWSVTRHASSESDTFDQSFTIGLWWDMSVSDGSTIRHVGLRSGMLVSDQICQAPMGLRYVSDNNNIILNSTKTRTLCLTPLVLPFVSVLTYQLDMANLPQHVRSTYYYLSFKYSWKQCLQN